MALGVTLADGWGKRLHFSASSGYVQIGDGSTSVTNGGVQMHGGGIECDNGIEIDVADNGTSHIDGGDCNTESATLANYVCKANQWTELSGFGDWQWGFNIIVGTSGSLTTTTTADGSGNDSMVMMNNAGILVNTGGQMYWTKGGFKTSGTGVFTQQGNLDYTPASDTSTDRCGLPFTQTKAAGGQVPVFTTHWSGTEFAGCSHQINWNTFSIQDGDLVTRTRPSESLIFSFKAGDTPLFTGRNLHVYDGIFQFTNAAFTVSSGTVTIENTATLNAFQQKLTLSSTVEVDIHFRGAGANCGQITGQDLTLNITTGVLKAINDDSSLTSGQQWSFFVTTNNINVLSDFAAGNIILPTGLNRNTANPKNWKFTS